MVVAIPVFTLPLILLVWEECLHNLETIFKCSHMTLLTLGFGEEELACPDPATAMAMAVGYAAALSPCLHPNS